MGSGIRPGTVGLNPPQAPWERPPGFGGLASAIGGFKLSGRWAGLARGAGRGRCALHAGPPRARGAVPAGGRAGGRAVILGRALLYSISSCSAPRAAPGPGSGAKMPALHIEDLPEKEKLKMEVEQLRKEVKLQRQQVSKCSEEIKNYIEERSGEDPLVKGIPEDKNPFKEKGSCVIS